MALFVLLPALLESLTRLSLAQRSASVVSPGTPLVLREFYLFDALKSLPDEADSLAALLLDTQLANVRELRAQLLIDLPASVSALARRMREAPSTAVPLPPTSGAAPAPTSAVGEPLDVATVVATAAPPSSVLLPGGLTLMLSELPPLPNISRVSLDLAALQRSLLASPPPDVSALYAELQNLWLEVPLNLEQPTYTVLKPLRAAPADDHKVDYEIRRYAAYAVALTELPSAVELDADGALAADAMGSGFGKLAGYIFGANEANRTLAMTMPVETVAAPKAGANGTMAFYLGPSSAAGSFPEPADGNVRVQVVPARTVAVVRFAGFATTGAVERTRRALGAQLAQDGVNVRKQPLSVLQYNPPYTLPHRRRNELAVPVDFADPAETARGEAGAMNILDELYDV